MPRNHRFTPEQTPGETIKKHPVTRGSSQDTSQDNSFLLNTGGNLVTGGAETPEAFSAFLVFVRKVGDQMMSAAGSKDRGGDTQPRAGAEQVRDAFKSERPWDAPCLPESKTTLNGR